MPGEVLSVVGGERVAEAGRRTPSTNPAQLSEVVGTVGSAGPEVFVRAASVAQSAQAAWAATPAPQRGQVISNVGRLMAANKERLAALVTREIGKPIAEALGEVQEIIDTCDFFLGGPPAVRADGAVGDARQATVHLPPSGRGRRRDHR